MLPTDSAYGGWPYSGEIDLMEMLGDNPTRVYGSAHFADASGQHQATTSKYVLPDASSYADVYHVFALEWEPGLMQWYVDGQAYKTLEMSAPFDQRFYLILNVAVGGNWPGAPDATTVFPQAMRVDYVRVYERSAVTWTAFAPVFLQQAYQP